MKKTSITYRKSGVNYQDLDPAKKLAQAGALKTSKNLNENGYKEISDMRGESAFVWQQGNVLMASVIEGLGTKNLVADQMQKITGKTYYDIIGHDTVATIINDLVSVGAKPLTINAYWAVGQSDWFKNTKRIKDLIKGWKNACNLAGVTWGGGETPTLKGIIDPNAMDLGGSAVGIIENKEKLISDKKLREGDRILLLKSNGVNANGISLTRAIAKKLPKGYATPINVPRSGIPSRGRKMYGKALLTKTNIYAKLIQDLLNGGIDIHYISNITGHGLRKIMRARQNYTYVIEEIFEPQEIFNFIQKHANLSDEEMYATYNMGMDYAIFLPQKDIAKAQKIIIKNGFKSINAGYVKKGRRQVIIKPKNLIYKGNTLDLR
ncbi:MAG: AIR synthase related protein [Patescibacteria group bacterium]